MKIIFLLDYYIAKLTLQLDIYINTKYIAKLTMQFHMYVSTRLWLFGYSKEEIEKINVNNLNQFHQKSNP